MAAVSRWNPSVGHLARFAGSQRHKALPQGVVAASQLYSGLRTSSEPHLKAPKPER